MTRSPQLRSQPHRLPDGGLIDRRQPLAFRFDGRLYSGYAGDTLASALLAAGVRLFGRSFKYHRPRGVLTAGSEEPNALVELRVGARREANTRATVIELFDGLTAVSQNRWPTLHFDLGAVSSLLAPLLPAGFYYKTFMWPAALWERLYEPLIRRAAGLGRASPEPDPDVYEKAHAFCDVLVIGGGPAGLSAALSAGRSGARVILCDEDFVLGGRLNAERRRIGGISGSAWVREAQAELESLAQVRVLTRTTVFGAYDGNMFGALERVADHMVVPAAHQPRQRLWKIVATRAVLAAGAIERPLVFDGNDRPGVMMASAVRTYLNRFGVGAGRCAMVFTATDDGWQTALELASAGIAIEAVVDTRDIVAPVLCAAVGRIGARLLLGGQVIETHGASGVRAVTVRCRDGSLQRFNVDTLCTSAGWSPSVALSTHLGHRPEWSVSASAFVPASRTGNMLAAGAARGSFTLADALSQGSAAGAVAAVAAGYRCTVPEQLATDDELTGAAAVWSGVRRKGKAFVDFQNDVTVADIELAVREGFRSVEHLKRYTTLGMGTDQGKTASVNGLGLLASLAGRSMAEMGSTSMRPPYTPIAIGALAGQHRGRHFKPTRLTSAHGWAQERGASFIDAGQWLRARWFAAPDESDWLQIVSREVRAVRTSVGVCDVSTLGKIDIQGEDAGVLLDRVYVNTFSTLPLGKVRYGLMLREDGFALDDGTTARLSQQHYLMSTTTANAAKVMQHLEHARQVLWPQLDVRIVSVTEQWSQYAVAGPNSRLLLQRLLGSALDVSDAAVPYLGCVEFVWSGMRARLFRISFSGERAYELAVPARYGDAVIRAIIAAGKSWNVVPYGTEALGVMRIEKGHVAGNEINGMTTAADLGMQRMLSTKKDFIGRAMARRAGLADPDRPALVGIKPVDAKTRLHAGAHLIAPGVAVSPQSDQGYLTSVAYSPALACWIGLGLLARGPRRIGEHVRAYDPVRSNDAPVEVVALPFIDPDGARRRG